MLNMITDCWKKKIPSFFFWSLKNITDVEKITINQTKEKSPISSISHFKNLDFFQSVLKKIYELNCLLKKIMNFINWIIVNVGWHKLHYYHCVSLHSILLHINILFLFNFTLNPRNYPYKLFVLIYVCTSLLRLHFFNLKWISIL